MKRTMWSVFAVLVLLAWAPATAAAQENPDLTMQVEVGFDGYCSADSWCPVRVILSNEGADVDGELVMPVEISSGGGTRSDLYTRQVVLPAHSRKAYFLHAPPVGVSSRSRLKVELRLDGKETVTRRPSVEWLDETERLYGVVSSDPSAFGFLPLVAPVGGGAQVAHLDLGSLPLEPLGWESLDVLVLNDADTTVLSGDQRRALDTWIDHGGHLIVGGGAGAARTAAGVADMLPVAIGGTRSVDSLDALGELIGAVSAQGPYAVAETTLQDGDVLIQQGDLILLARRSHGAGRVDLMAYDAGLNPLSEWDDLAHLWDWIVGTGASRPQRFAVRDGYSAYEAVNSVPGRGLPSILHIMAFLLVYVLLIGPVNYIVLHKLDRRELAWLTIPILIVGFSGCAYVTGFQLRGHSAIVHRLAMVYVPDEASVGRSYQLVGLFSPRRTNYDVWVPGARVRGIPAEYYYGSSAQSALYLREEAEGVTIGDVRVDVGGVEPFMVEGYQEISPVEADLQLVESGGLWLEGTVRNGATALKDALVIVGSNEQRLGDLDANEEVNIRVPFYTLVGPGGYVPNLPDLIIGTGNYWEDPKLHRRYMLLQSLFAPYARTYGGTNPGTTSVLDAGAYLIGWDEEDTPLLVEVAGRPYSTEDMTLYVYALPLNRAAEGAEITIPSTLVTREVVEVSGQVETWPEGFYMAPESSVTFRFTWSVVDLQQVDAFVVEVRDGGYYGTGAIAPDVSLWNQETGEWDRLDIAWGINRIADVDAYVISSGSVLMRMETGDQIVEMGSLSVSVEGK